MRYELDIILIDLFRVKDSFIEPLELHLCLFDMTSPLYLFSVMVFIQTPGEVSEETPNPTKPVYLAIILSLQYLYLDQLLLL